MNRKLTLAVLAAVPALALAAGPGKVRTAPARAPAKATQAAAPAPAPAPAADEGAEVEVAPAPMEGGAQAGEEGRGALPPPDTYTVRSGDTLWDLAGRFLNNPWYWPKIWSYNPEITNPHWIFPGNLLRFFNNGEEAPVRVAPMAAAEPDEEEEGGEQVKQLEDLSRADFSKEASADEKDVVAVAGPYKIGYVPSRNSYARHDAFVTPAELEGSGVIKSAFEERELLVSRDRAYASFRETSKLKVGETYAVYRTVRPVKHPVTKALIGYQSLILGAARVVGVEDKGVRLVITSSFDEIQRGDLLGPWVEKPYRAVSPKPNAKAMEGYIVTSPVEVLTIFAQTQVVFVDRGRADGVEEGNRFTVVRAGDPKGTSAMEVQPWDPASPKEDVGALLVVDVKEHASAALVTRSLTELMAGDRVEMRASAR